ncbi:tRNA pseudouridine synthase A [Senna tora]|uniref:tRNA pseudouridine synthase A n=1 Tax=Senna tora TaxID=362788 RepID=A0A834WMN6_9FABA|nr:tRNA pseudouridine synthase A [Senna tora]
MVWKLGVSDEEVRDMVSNRKFRNEYAQARKRHHTSPFSVYVVYRNNRRGKKLIWGSYYTTATGHCVSIVGMPPSLSPLYVNVTLASVATVRRRGQCCRRASLPPLTSLFLDLSERGLLLSFMEKQQKNEDYVHYNHIDSSRYARWTARESYQFMYARPWQLVSDFYLNVVQGGLSLSALFGAEVGFSMKAYYAFVPIWLLLSIMGKRLRHTSVPLHCLCDSGIQASSLLPKQWFASFEFGFLIPVDQNDTEMPELPEVSELERSASEVCCGSIVEGSLGEFVDEKKAQMLKDKDLPVEGCAVVAGRTDKGVTGLQQVNIDTWRKDVKPRDIEDAINHAAPGKIRVISVSQVSRVFHPNFSAKWRRYLYIFPLTDGEYRDQSSGNEFCENFRCNEIHDSISKDEFESEKKSYVFSIRKVNQLLQNLEGKLLSYKMFARDTKASRNDGPPTECFVFHARAMETRLPITVQGEETRVMCVELVANRFLRKMVRVLVATSIREAAAGAEDDVLLKLMEATCRRATAPPAPPEGLCLVDVGYTEFSPKRCIIRKE